MGQRIHVGNQRGERRHAPSPERHRWRLTFSARTGEEPIAIGICWVGGHSPTAPREEQRWQCRYRISEGSRDTICGCSGFFRYAAKGKTGLVAASVTLRAFGNRAAAGPMVLPHAMAAIRI